MREKCGFVVQVIHEDYKVNNFSFQIQKVIQKMAQFEYNG